MNLKIIVAIDFSDGIGKDNKLPWHIPEELKYFKETTMGHTMIMGRKTFESIGKALPGRKSIVISSQKDFKAEGAMVVESIEEAIKIAPDGFIIGGAAIFESSLKYVKTLYVTHLDIETKADRFFPTIDPKEWKKLSCEYKISKSGIGMNFCIYTRI